MTTEPSSAATSPEVGRDADQRIAAVPASHDHHDDHHILREPEDGDRWAWRRRIRSNPAALRWYRVGVALAGVLVMLLAAVSGPLPGPGGIPLFLVGLAILSSEFTWAHRLRVWFTNKLRDFRGLSTRAKVAIVAGIIVIALGASYVGMVVIGPPAWLPDRVQGWLRSLPGVS